MIEKTVSKFTLTGELPVIMRKTFLLREHYHDYGPEIGSQKTLTKKIFFEAIQITIE